VAHPITDLLAGRTPAERHAIKASALAAIGAAMVGQSITRAGWTFTLLSAPIVTASLLEFSVGIRRAGKDVTPPDLNPIRIYNPPILVPDPAGDVEVVTPKGTTRFREDLPAATLAIVRDLFSEYRS